MAIVVEKVLGNTPRGVRATVLHGDQRLDVEVVGDRERITLQIGRSLVVELGFESVRSSRTLEASTTTAHGVFADREGTRVVGRVQNVIDAEPFLVDLYIATGPELLVLEADDLSGRRPEVGSGLEVVVTGLACYPTWT